MLRYLALLESRYLTNKHIHFLSLLSVGMLVLIFFRANHKVSSWNFTHWLFNYQDEFVKRGLVGEVVRLFGVGVNHDLVTFLALMVSLIVVVALAVVFSRPLRQAPQQAGLWLFFLFAVTHAATLQHFVYDSGRFDGITVGLMLLALSAVCSATTGFTSLIVPVLLSVAILVHEAAFFIVVPLVLAFWRQRYASMTGLAGIGAVFLGLLILTHYVATAGLVSGQSYEEHLRHLQVAADTRVHEESLAVLHKGSIPENIRLTLDEGVTLQRLYHHAFMLLGLLPSVVLLWLLIGPLVHDKSVRYGVAAAFSPLLLYPLGHDHFRWWALAITNLFIQLSLLSWQRVQVREHICSVMTEHKLLTILAIVIAFITGPLGITDSFPRFIIR
jgi:hypothetical protein